MEYDSKLTNSENIKKLISEQSVIGAPSYGVNTSPKDDSKPKEEEKPKYPDYCRYPKNAALPTKNSAGVSGEDALIKGFCFYPPGIYLPANSEINFWDIETYSYAADKHLEKYDEDRAYFISNLTEICPIGSVLSFYIGKEKYTTWIEQPRPGSSWKFRGFYSKEPGHRVYEGPKWVDVRNDYQRFVDDYGFAIQITAAIGTAIAGALTGGAAWVLWAEIILEGGLGIAVGWRELEKGENVSASLSFITGLLPMLKLSKLFRGIPEAEFKELSKSLAEAGFTKTTKIEDYVLYYNKLPETQQKIMSKLLGQDEITRNALLKELKQSMSDELPDLITAELKLMVKTNPEMLKSIPFFEKLWARELTTNTFFIALGILVNTIWGDILNAEDLEKLSGVYSVVPESLKKEMAFNLVSNAEILPKLANSESFQKIKKLGTLENAGKNWAKYFNTHLKDSIEEAGGKYTELPDNEEKAVEDKVGNKRDEKELRRMGFIPITELTDDQQPYDYTRLNHVEWVKITQ